MYKIVQTIGNKIAGGASGGLFNVAKASIEFLVSKLAKSPTSKGKAIALRNSFKFSVRRNDFNFIAYPFKNNKAFYSICKKR